MGKKLDKQANQRRNKYTLQQKLGVKTVGFFQVFLFFLLGQEGVAEKSISLRRGWGSWILTAWSCGFGENLTSGTSACVEVIKDMQLGSSQPCRVGGQGIMSSY